MKVATPITKSENPDLFFLKTGRVWGHIHIFIDDFLHLRIPFGPFRSPLIHAYKDVVKDDPNFPKGVKYCIDFQCLFGRNIETEYASEEMWLEILDYLSREL